MKSQDFKLVRYDADEGYVFDWAEPRYSYKYNENREVIKKTQQHLYTKTLFIGGNDNIENYIEVPEVKE